MSSKKGEDQTCNKSLSQHKFSLSNRKFATQNRVAHISYLAHQGDVRLQCVFSKNKNKLKAETVRTIFIWDTKQKLLQQLGQFSQEIHQTRRIHSRIFRKKGSTRKMCLKPCESIDLLHMLMKVSQNDSLSSKTSNCDQ